MGGFIRKILQRKTVQQALSKTKPEKAMTPAGPTEAEMMQDEDLRMSRIKRKGRKATKLAKNNEDLSLATKSLLG
tara:strand:+ start:53 stop:277 length:225 start_codon:yes stop_codon:yes gene_type:complete